MLLEDIVFKGFILVFIGLFVFYKWQDRHR